jgi:hypothetical protein
MPDGNKGKAVIQQLGAGSQLTGTPSITFNQTILRCTSAEVVTLSIFNFLVTHDAFTGTVRRFLLHPDGTLNTQPASEFTEGRLKDKNIGKAWLQYQPSPLWDEGCGAGGWSASSREMIEFLFAIRYRHIFSPANNDWLSDLLLSAELKDSSGETGSTALAWGVPWTAETDGEKNLGKDGLVSSHGVGLSTYLTRLPNNCDGVIFVNTRPGDAEPLLKGAYQYGKGIADDPPEY